MRKNTGIILTNVIALFGLITTLLVSPASVVASPQAALVQKASRTYIIQPGDFLQGISLRFGTSVQAIVEANGIQNPDLIWPGQSLVIPAAPQSGRSVSSVEGSQLEEAVDQGTEPQQEPVSTGAGSENGPTLPNAIMNERETAMLDGINAQRTAAGLPRLRFEPSFMPIALARSNDMATRGYFSHTTPEGTRVQDLVRAAGLGQAVVGEILARNNYPADKSVAVSIDAFMKSENHRAHILSPVYVEAAVGEARTPQGMQYYTVILASD